MTSSQQPDDQEYVVVADMLYIDGRVLRKGDRLGPNRADARLYRLLSLAMIQRADEQDLAVGSDA